MLTYIFVPQYFENLLFVNIYSLNCSAAFTSILEQLAELRSSQGQETGPDRLVREAAQGHIEVVRDILLKYPDKVCGIYFFIIMFDLVNFIILLKFKSILYMSIICKLIINVPLLGRPTAQDHIAKM